MIMMAAPLSPAATPLSSPVESTAPSLLNKHSLASLRSVFTLSVCSAPAVRDDKSHPVVASVRCPHCLEPVTVADLAGLLYKDGPAQLSLMDGDLVHNPKKGNLKLQTSGIGFDCAGILDVDSAASILLKTLHETNNELQTHCRDLHQLRLASPSPPPSRPGSVHSLHSQSSEEPASPSSLMMADSISSSDKRQQSRGLGFQSGHPLISDLGDLVNLSHANFRLLQTLQDKVNKVDRAEKTLRAEREAIERERAQLKQMSAEVERERARLMSGGLGWDSYKVCSLLLLLQKKVIMSKLTTGTDGYQSYSIRFDNVEEQIWRRYSGRLLG